MKKVLPAVVLVAATAAATTALVLPSATAEPQSSTPVPAQTAPAAPQLVTGLPDFTRLVEQVAPGVVSIEVVVGAPTAQGPRGQVPQEEMLPEIFRRFFARASRLIRKGKL